MRVSVLAVVRHHIYPRVKVHRIDTVTAIDGVYARVIMRVNLVVAGTGVYRVDAALVSAYQVGTAPADHFIVAGVTPNLVSTPLARQRVVAPVAANAVSAARA